MDLLPLDSAALLLRRRRLPEEDTVEEGAGVSELVRIEELIDVQTGETLPATVQNAGRVISAARDMKGRIGEVIAQATAYLSDEAARQGTKTLRDGGTTVTLSGGLTDEYDPADLMDALREAGCPEDRIDEAVVATVTYKVNKSVLRQLAGANIAYRAAIEEARYQYEKPMRASVKEGSIVDDRDH